MKKVFFLTLLLGFGLLIQIYQQWPDSNLRVIFCDVGQGDAILVTHGFWQMLIDAGERDDVINCLNDNLPFWDKTVEVSVVTHNHADHIGGFQHVLANYRTNNLYLADVGESQHFVNMLKALKDHAYHQTHVKSGVFGQRITFSSSGEAIILAPTNGNLPFEEMLGVEFSETMLSDTVRSKYIKDDDPNERSIVILLRYGQFELLLMGDATHKNELALISTGLIKKVEGLKVGHHGSKTSSHPLFIQQSQPEFSVISNGENNKFGHPNSETLQILEENRVQILRTDELGSIKLTTNGEYYWFD